MHIIHIRYRKAQNEASPQGQTDANRENPNSRNPRGWIWHLCREMCQQPWIEAQWRFGYTKPSLRPMTSASTSTKATNPNWRQQMWAQIQWHLREGIWAYILMRCEERIKLPANVDGRSRMGVVDNGRGSETAKCAWVWPCICSRDEPKHLM